MSNTRETVYDSLHAVINEADAKPRLTLGECVSLLHGAGILLPLLFFSLLGLLPLAGIPGFSLLIGIPVMILAFELLTGREMLWLPDRLAQKPFAAHKLARSLKRLLPWLHRLDGILKPRLLMLSQWPFRNALALPFIALALLLILPLPLTNPLLSLGLVLLSLGLLYRDGYALLLAVGYTAALMTVIVLFVDKS